MIKRDTLFSFLTHSRLGQETSMEPLDKVVFLFPIKKTKQKIPCFLNTETLVCIYLHKHFLVMFSSLIFLGNFSSLIFNHLY